MRAVREPVNWDCLVSDLGNGRDLPALMAKGIRHHQRKRYANAERLYRLVLRSQPDHPDALHFLGVLAHQRGDSERAILLIKKAIESVPDNPDALNNLGRVLLETGETQEAVITFRSAVEINTGFFDAWLNLGVAFRKMGEPTEATSALAEAIRLEPTHAGARYQLGIAYKEAGFPKEAIAAFQEALRSDPGLTQVYESLGSLLYRSNRIDEAAEVYAAWLRREPNNPKADHMYRSTSGHEIPDRAANDYVTSLFDGFAETFDENLARLQYRAPRLVADMVRGLIPEGGQLRILDAGCGTGLCGPLLQPLARHLIGVDLSPGMLEKAAQRRCYDSLVEDELEAFLLQNESSFDIVVSADTLVYFGKLTIVLDAAYRALHSGGWFVYTVEECSDASQDMVLNPHGRYSHAHSYVDRVMKSVGFIECSIERVDLRLENKEPVGGFLVKGRRRPSID